MFVTVCTEPGSCPVCGEEKWKVQKTRRRQGKTLTCGQFEARETVYACATGCKHQSGILVTHRAVSLIEQILPNSVLGYDVMVCVGLERFLEHQQREQIRSKIMNQYGIHVSSGEMSRLSHLFADYLARLHHACAERLKAVLESDGGWPMNVDATGEAGRGTLFVVMAGWRQWVLGAWKIATERAELILPCLRETVLRFGAPCAAVRDLGRAVIPALEDFVSNLGQDIPVLACHQHFLADIGEDLLEPSHNELRKLFKRTGVRPKLRALAREIGLTIGEEIGEARQAVLQWQSMTDTGYRLPAGRDGLAIVRAMAQWTLDYPAEATGLDFPFDRPYLYLHDRCQTVLKAADAFLHSPPEDGTVVRALRRLHRVLLPVDCEVPFRRITKRLRRRARLFDELRNTLRLSAEPPGEETEQDLDEMHGKLDALVASLKGRRPQRGPAGDMREAIDIILEHIDRHGDNLWGHSIALPESAGGGVRLVARTNFLLENMFKEMKHGERRRSGRKNLTQDLENLPAEAALVHNLKRSDYVEIVCGSLDRLPETFAKLDREARERELKGLPAREQEEAGSVLQLSSASLSTADRRVVRTEAMNRKVLAAAMSSARGVRNSASDPKSNRILTL